MATPADFAAEIQSAFAGSGARLPSTEEIQQLIEDAPRTLKVWFSKGNAAEFCIEARMWRKSETPEGFDLGVDVNFLKSAAARMNAAKAKVLRDNLTAALQAGAQLAAWLQSNPVYVPLETARDQVTDLKSLMQAWMAAQAAYDADPTPGNQQAVADAQDAFYTRAEEIAGGG